MALVVSSLEGKLSREEVIIEKLEASKVEEIRNSLTSWISGERGRELVNVCE